jgi:plasmid stabilization system protein ParE
MIRRVATTERADANVRDIATYLALDNDHAAPQFGVDLWTCLSRVAQNPGVGHAVPEFDGLRATRITSRFWRYLVFYRSPDSETVEAVRVLYSARDLAVLLHDSA